MKQKRGSGRAEGGRGEQKTPEQKIAEGFSTRNESKAAAR
jgi:hypothetical protein